MSKVSGLTIVAIVAGLGAAPASASLYPSYIRAHYPKSIQPLMLRLNNLDAECQGTGSDAACARRDAAYRLLKARGWCWGSTNHDAYEAAMTYLPCSKDRTRPLQ